MHARLAVVVFFLLLPAWGAEIPHARIVRTAERIRVDGQLNEDVWRTSRPIGPFTQAEPDTGQPPREPTDVWLAYNDRALYIAVRSHDRQPGKIFTTTKARDARPFDDDCLEIVIDTFLDGRNGYYFQVNAAGSMSDGRIVENRMANVSWDGIWDAKTTHRRGWLGGGDRDPFQDGLVQTGCDLVGIQHREDHRAVQRRGPMVRGYARFPDSGGFPLRSH